MLHQTKGIVLHQVKYSETSIVAKIYTELFGVQSYLVRGVRKRKSKTSNAHFQHLSLLDMTVYHKQKSSLQNIKEIRQDYHFQEIPYDISKSSIAIFINEMVYKSIKEEEANPALFNFIFDSVRFLDLVDRDYNCFHLMFCSKLTRFLGFYPRGEFSDSNSYFDLQEGEFCAHTPIHDNYMNAECSKILHGFIQHSYEDLGSCPLNKDLRNLFLSKIIDYYRLHIHGMGEIKSHTILQSIF
ncbi:MAG: DNA repair protein RecO [Bacteroidales bacterium]|nr:DNA repair protein RecO [Bacteroidales bacterium]